MDGRFNVLWHVKICVLLFLHHSHHFQVDDTFHSAYLGIEICGIPGLYKFCIGMNLVQPVSPKLEEPQSWDDFTSSHFSSFSNSAIIIASNDVGASGSKLKEGINFFASFLDKASRHVRLRLTTPKNTRHVRYRGEERFVS
jgi:hypothetical protein